MQKPFINLIPSFAGALLALASGPSFSGEIEAQGTNLCEFSFQQSRARLPELDYQDFDKQGGDGWRKLYDEHCYKESAALIAEFSQTAPELSAQQQRNLNFHQGQALAIGGNTAAALAAFKLCFRPVDDQNGFRWNAYLRGTIAFLSKDTSALLAARDELRAHAENVGNRINLGKLENFVAHPEWSYADAYSKPTH
jgi:hypothetical protein